MAKRASRKVAPRRRRAPRRARIQRGGKGDSAALRGIKQGSGRSVARPFGGTTSARAFHPCHHDAFHHAHLPLPRAIGPYTIVRTTQIITTNAALQFFGPVFDRGAGKWSNICGVSFSDVNSTIGGTGKVSLNAYSAMTSKSWDGCQVAPAAFSVQLMNPNALQTTSGIVYIGRVRTAYKPSEDLSTKVVDLANELVNYNNPRLCSAGKLALRGVQVDAVPFNMNELSNFTPLSQPSFSTYGQGSPNPTGFAPVFIYNPNNIALQALVCCEWRVRFDPSNPAQATHVHHPPAPESAWAAAQRYAESIGNGVVDIADKVAASGQAVYQAMGAMYGVARGARALAGAARPMLALM